MTCKVSRGSMNSDLIKTVLLLAVTGVVILSVLSLLVKVDAPYFQGDENSC